MVKSEDLRDIVITHYKNGKTATEIAILLANKVHRTTILRWTRQYDQTGSFCARKSTGRKRSGRTKRLINLVKRRLASSDSRKILRTMAKDFHSSRSTVERVLKEDLKKNVIEERVFRNLRKIKNHFESDAVHGL